MLEEDKATANRVYKNLVMSQTTKSFILSQVQHHFTENLLFLIAASNAT